jgi:hypothetical protein
MTAISDIVIAGPIIVRAKFLMAQSPQRQRADGLEVPSSSSMAVAGPGPVDSSHDVPANDQG